MIDGVRLYGWSWARRGDGAERAGSTKEMSQEEALAMIDAGLDVRPAEWAEDGTAAPVDAEA